GDTISFVSVASGTPAPAYQWQLFGTNLPGTTTTRLQLNSVTLAQSGPYAAFISNAAGSITSATATLSVYSSASATLTPSLSLSNSYQFTIGITGVPGYKYSIQASTNLLDWTTLQTNSSPSL